MMHVGTGQRMVVGHLIHFAALSPLAQNPGEGVRGADAT